jgi:hypothetical protein
LRRVHATNAWKPCRSFETSASSKCCSEGVQVAEILAVEAAQRLDVLDLLHGEDVEIDVLDALGDDRAVRRPFALDQLSAEGPELEGGRVLQIEGDGLTDGHSSLLCRRQLAAEVEAGEQVVHVESAKGEGRHGGPPFPA